MGLKEFFFGRKDPADGRAKKIVKAEQKITNMFIQAADRQYFLDQLRADGSQDAARVLLKRFASQCENLTVDRDEKEMTCHFLVAMGEFAVDPIKDYLRRNDEFVNWPLRALRELLSPDDFTLFITELLTKIGPDYVRHPERKEQLILLAKSLSSPDVTRSLLPYVTDHNETIRFLAVDTLIHFADPIATEPLIEALPEEESQRVITRVLDGLASLQWTIPEPLRATLKAKLSHPFYLSAEFKVARA